MDQRNIVHVKIGEVKVGSGDQILKTTLGSCVGIAFLDRDKGVCGLAHCLLPNSGIDVYQIGAKYVDQAVYSLTKLMKVDENNKKNIEVYLAGGGNVVETLAKNRSQHIGELNFESAKKYLKSYGYKIKESSSSGGTDARQMLVDCRDYLVTVVTISQINEQLMNCE